MPNPTKLLLFLSVLFAVTICITMARSSTDLAGEPFILGAYSLKADQTEAYAAVLHAMGYSPDMAKKIQNATISVIRIAKDRDKFVVGWTLNLCESIHESEVNTYSGQEFTLTLCDSRDVTAKNEWDPNKQQATRTMKFEKFECKQTATHISRAGLRVKIRCKNKEVDLEFVPLAFSKK